MKSLFFFVWVLLSSFLLASFADAQCSARGRFAARRAARSEGAGGCSGAYYVAPVSCGPQGCQMPAAAGPLAMPVPTPATRPAGASVHAATVLVERPVTTFTR
jgi:hypothetical protein